MTETEAQQIIREYLNYLAGKPPYNWWKLNSKKYTQALKVLAGVNNAT